MFVAVARALGARVRRNRRAEPDACSGCATTAAVRPIASLRRAARSRRAPCRATGTIGTRACSAVMAAPFLNRRGVPSGDRSPSGKSTSTQVAPEPEGAGLHRADQVRVGIDRHDVHQLGEPAHERRLEVLARADEEQAAERPVGQRPYQQEGVEIALVVRADEVRALRRQVLAPLHAKPEEQSRAAGSASGRPRTPARRTAASAAGCPAAPGPTRRRSAPAPTGRPRPAWARLTRPPAGSIASTRFRTVQDALGDVVGHVHAELVLQSGEQFHALHRVEPEVELEVRVRTDGRSVRRGAADDRQNACHVRVRGPHLVFARSRPPPRRPPASGPASRCTGVRSRGA